MRSVRSQHRTQRPRLATDLLLTVVNRYYRLGTTPQHQPLFEDLAKHTSSLLARTANTTLPSRPPASDGPTAKKRKLQNGDSGETAQASVDMKNGDAPVQFYVQDVSFATPQRKKLTLEITAGHRFLRARNQTTKEIEFGVSMDKIREFEPVTDLPVLEQLLISGNCD